jgi:hypothetical protein
VTLVTSPLRLILTPVTIVRAAHPKSCQVKSRVRTGNIGNRSDRGSLRDGRDSELTVRACVTETEPVGLSVPKTLGPVKNACETLSLAIVLDHRFQQKPLAARINRVLVR